MKMRFSDDVFSDCEVLRFMSKRAQRVSLDKNILSADVPTALVVVGPVCLGLPLKPILYRCDGDL
jgi:hypothetical protein